MDEHLRDLVDTHLAEAKGRMDARGFGGRVGFGHRAAVLVVDLIRAFTEEGSPLASDLDAEVETTRRILRAARAANSPVVFSTVFYDDNLLDAGIWHAKIPSNDALVEGSRWVEVDPRLERAPQDALLVKKYASCFFGTDLASRLISQGVDTLIVVGASTSGCVRASAMDGCSLGFRTIVVRDAVGDRAPLSHLVNLFDLDAKYADVVDAAEVIEWLEQPQ